MTVRDNVLFGLQMKRTETRQALARADRMLELVQLSEFSDRKPAQLSGGQQQRVALARALAPEPVTHDQEEALTMSDRIAVMSQGLVQQVGDAEAIYQRPANRFVADFIGDTNFLSATVVSSQASDAVVSLAGGVECTCQTSDKVNIGEAGVLCIRPESISWGITQGKVTECG